MPLSSLPTQLQQPLSTTTIALITISVLIVLIVTAYLARQYVRCPADKILVISGHTPGEGSGVRCLRGRGALVVPLLQEHGFLSLRPLSIDVDVSPALTREREVRADISTSWSVAIATDERGMETAATRLLGLDDERVREQARGLIVGGIRAAVATLTLDEIDSDRPRICEVIEHRVRTELSKIGMTVTRCDISDVRSSQPAT